jgi:hypothetical protein
VPAVLLQEVWYFKQACAAAGTNFLQTFVSFLSFFFYCILERSVGYGGSSIDCSHPPKTHPTKTLPRRNFFADRVDSISEALHWIDGHRDT